MKRVAHEAFKETALRDPAVKAEYERLMADYKIISTFIKARKRAHKTQEEVARLMKTTASVVSRIEAGGGTAHHSPSLGTLKKYAAAVGCELEVRLKPRPVNNNSAMRD